MYLIQVVGFKNSGKTTLITEWIHFLESKGLTIGTVKHHGHGGEPDQVNEKDTDKHKKAGAQITTVTGEKNILVNTDLRHLSFNKILDLYDQLSIDVVFLEGYKQYPFPKIVLLKDKEDLSLLRTVENVQAIYSYQHLHHSLDGHILYTTNKQELFRKMEKRWEVFHYFN